MQNIYVTHATPADAEMIANISRETFYDAFAEQNTKEDMDKFLAEQFSKESLMAEVGVDGHIFLLAYADNEPAGYVFLKIATEAALQNNKAMEVSRIYARKPFIGKGIGKMLLQAAFTEARLMEKEIIWLGVWEHNRRAIEFYTLFGFEKFSEHDFVLGTDVQRDWLMKYNL